MNKEELKAIEYYKNREVTFTIKNFDTEKFLKALGITEEDSLEKDQIRIKTLLNLIEKQQIEINELKNKLCQKIDVEGHHQVQQWKKIAEKLTEKLLDFYEDNENEEDTYCETTFKNCEIPVKDITNEKCKQCIIDWAKSEVQKRR